jgi:hypothetical protein
MSSKYFAKLAKSSGTSNKKFESAFGMKILKSMGWEEGKGLGENLDGSTECVRM